MVLMIHGRTLPESILLFLLFAAASLAAGCSLDVDGTGFGKACSAGRCATGYVCDPANRCVFPVDLADAAAGGGALGAPDLTGGTNTGAGGSSSSAGGVSAGHTATGSAGQPSKQPTPEADASGPARDAGAGATTSMDASGDATPDSSCSKPVRRYRDADGDGFGRSDVFESFCGPPPTGWADKDGDCNDAEPRAFPGQTSYFGTTYRLGGDDSFDYDCTGAEEPDPASAGAALDCPALALLVCTGSGFARTNRQRVGVDPTCGSTELVTCAGFLACVASSAIVSPMRSRSTRAFSEITSMPKLLATSWKKAASDSEY